MKTKSESVKVPQEPKKETAKSTGKSFPVKPSQVTTIICGNDLIYTGTGVTSVHIDTQD